MVCTYRFIEELSIADACFEAEGETLEELLKASALATFAIMAEVDKIEPLELKRVSLEEETPDMLLFSWLEELVFLKDREGILFSRFDITIEDRYTLDARLYGQLIRDYKGELGRDVKAVTMHLFEVKQKASNGWWARVVLDI